MLPFLLFVVGADVFALPRVDFDMHPGTMAFMIFCGALTAGILIGILALGLYSGSTDTDGRQQADRTAGEAEGEPEPFVPDEAKPDVSRSVDRLFGTDARSRMRVEQQ